jgi:hypothetical protein
MPICPLIAQDAMVMPDCSLLVTTFSIQSWPLQRMATRVTSMVAFIAWKNTRLLSTLQGLCQPGLRRFRKFTGWLILVK